MTDVIVLNEILAMSV